MFGESLELLMFPFILSLLIHHSIQAAFINKQVKLWSIPVPYAIDVGYNESEIATIERALQMWSENTCLQFQKNTEWLRETSQILFSKGDAINRYERCSSSIGKRFDWGSQFITTGPGCFSLGGMLHEIGHSLGFMHEQSRPDRDQKVKVVLENVDARFLQQFYLYDSNLLFTGDTPYDYESVMHYPGNYFSFSKDRITLKTLDPDYQATIGQREVPSFMDVKLVNEVYCGNVCPPNPRCERGGYANPRNCATCVCPHGFAGPTCNEIESSKNANCGGFVDLQSDQKIEISSPNFPKPYDFNQKCTWLIRCPSEKKVNLQFIGTVDVFCNRADFTCLDYVEIKNGPDFANTGPHFCCDFQPQNGIVSYYNEMLVLFRSFNHRQRNGFQANVHCI